MELQLAEAIKTLEEREREFTEELQKLKEQAEQRKIERTGDLKRLQLIQSEIDLLTSQKESFIEDARLARTSASHSLKQLEALQEERSESTLLLKQREGEIEELKDKSAILIEDIRAAQERASLSLQQLERGRGEFLEACLWNKLQIESAQEEILKLQTLKSSTRVEALYTQLRSQFDEKSKILSATRKELFKLGEKSLIREKGMPGIKQMAVEKRALF